MRNEHAHAQQSTIKRSRDNCIYIYIYSIYILYIYIYVSVNPRISILVSDEAECSDAEFSGAVTAPSNSFFE